VGVSCFGYGDPAMGDPSRSIDDLIFDIAEHQRGADYAELYERMQSHLFYVPLSAPLAGPPGTKIVVGQDVSTRHVLVHNMKMFVFFTTDIHPDLGAVFAGIEGAEALRMTVASPDIDGAVFQNAKASWVGFDKQKCRQLVG
jgi:hypothetical protein